MELLRSLGERLGITAGRGTGVERTVEPVGLDESTSVRLGMAVLAIIEDDGGFVNSSFDIEDMVAGVFVMRRHLAPPAARVSASEFIGKLIASDYVQRQDVYDYGMGSDTHFVKYKLGERGSGWMNRHRAAEPGSREVNELYHSLSEVFTLKPNLE